MTDEMDDRFESVPRHKGFVKCVTARRCVWT